MKASAVAVISSVVLALLLAACGGGEPTPASPQEPTTPPDSPTPAGLGTLEIRVTDLPTDGITSILVTVRNIEVNVSGGSVEAG